VKGVVENR